MTWRLVVRACGRKRFRLRANCCRIFTSREPAGALHVLNAPSPAATAALAIADEILDMAGDALAQ